MIPDVKINIEGINVIICCSNKEKESSKTETSCPVSSIIANVCSKVAFVNSIASVIKFILNNRIERTYRSTVQVKKVNVVAEYVIKRSLFSCKHQPNTIPTSPYKNVTGSATRLPTINVSVTAPMKKKSPFFQLYLAV